MIKTVTADIIHEADRQEELPEYSEDFPYIMTRAEIDRFPQSYVPWHWHQAVELFYMESGELEYHTPGGTVCFPVGSGGIVNSGVLHMTQPHPEKGETVQLLHIFDPFFLADSKTGYLARQFILPYLDSGAEIIAFYPDIPAHRELLTRLQASFRMTGKREGFELYQRSVLSDLWLRILNLTPEEGDSTVARQANTRLKLMLGYIHTHYAETFLVANVAAAGMTSERDCYRLFQERLHCPPNAYIIGYRLNKACELLRKNKEPVTMIAQSCGFGSSSHFSKFFTKRYGCTPSQYRKDWQDRDKIRRK